MKAKDLHFGRILLLSLPVRHNELSQMILRILVLIFFLSLFHDKASGQHTHQDVHFHHLTIKDGLSQSTIRSIHQDSQGYMWVGTLNGLNKYDGYNITVYRHDPEDPGSISFDEIGYIFGDSNHNLWIGTLGKGINKYNRDLDQFNSYKVDNDQYEAGLSENTVYTISEDQDGYLWIGTDYGLNRFNPKSDDTEFVHYFADEESGSLSDNRITTLLTDSKNNLWVGTLNGLNVKKNGSDTFKTFLHDPKNDETIGGNIIRDIKEDSDGYIWVAVKSGGLNKIDPDTFEITIYRHDEHNPYSISDNSVYSIHEDSFGNMWVGTEIRGLNLFDRTTERFYRYRHNPANPNSISNSAIYTINESNDRTLWIGTYMDGINYVNLNPPRFEFYQQQPYRTNTLNNNNIVSFEEHTNGNIWVGTDGGGLNLFDPDTKQFNVIRNIPGNPGEIPSSSILDIREHNGELWLAMYEGGVSRFNLNGTDFTHYRHDPENPKTLNTDDAYRLYFTDENEVWIGTHGGGINVLDLDTENFRHYAREEVDDGSLQNNYVQDLFKDSKNTMWAATHGSGIARFNSRHDTFKHYAEYEGTLSSIAAIVIHEDKQGRFWVGTSGGLNLFNRDTETYRAYTVEDGLANNFINGILEDDEGNLWLSTNSGISKFYPDQEIFENYDIDSGLPGNEFITRSYFMDSKGYHYFGGNRGFVRFHSDNVRLQEYVPSVVFTNFMIFNQPAVIGEDGPLKKHINQTDHISLSYQHSVITFEFVTLNFEHNKSDQFAYKLEGFDPDWNYVGNKRSATYTNLNPGKYRFNVKAANSDGVWSAEYASIDFTIAPPFWKTAWFYTLAVIFGVGLIVGITKWRVSAISERNRKLELEISRHTRELSERNNTLRDTLEELKSTRDQLIEKAHKAGMADLATSVLHDVGNILNSVNTSSALIDDIISHSSIHNLRKANELLRANIDKIDDFILNDPRGKTLLQYYLKLEEPIDEEYHQLELQNKRLAEKISLITEVISAQQNYSTGIRLQEKHNLEQIIEDTITLKRSVLELHNIKISTQFEFIGEIDVEKTKLIHILINLIKNAKESILERNPEEKNIRITTNHLGSEIKISITDNGSGFTPENKSRIFTHGFTTKANGHGFGLHSCANYAREMNGTLLAKSDGPDKGATFSLYLPAAHSSHPSASDSEPAFL